MKTVNSTYRIISLILAFLMFFSSVGFSIDMHYCQGQLKSFSLLGKAKNCHEMTQAKMACPHHQQQLKPAAEKGCSMSDEKDCCNSETLFFQADHDQNIQASNVLISSQTQQFIAAFVVAFIQSTTVENASPVHAFYKPPLILKDIPVLLASFLL